MERQFPITINLSYAVHDEWMMKEEGSYEDHNQPEKGHVYCILRDNWNYKNNKLTINNEEELALLKKSADYQRYWDSDDPIVKRLMKKAGEIFRLQLA